jgi:hypothetical protein
MTEPELLLETAAGEPAMESPEAPHSWDPSGRNVPATKLDWTESLPFRQVRGMQVASDPKRPLQGSGES